MSDALDCKEPARCRSCEHFRGGSCALEASLQAALEAMAPRPPRTSGVLASADLRRASA